MDLQHISDRVQEHGEKIAAHEQEIKTLFNQQKNIEKLAESTQKLAISVKELTNGLCDVDSRIEAIEHRSEKKSFAVWQAVVSALIGGAVTFLITSILA